MKNVWVAILIGVVAIDAGWHGVHQLLMTIDRGKAKRELADCRSIVTAIDSYKASQGQYPIAMTTEQLTPLLVPQYIRQLPSSEVHYFSDGAGYTFILWPWGTQPYPMRESGHGPLEVRNGVLVAWPDSISLDGPLKLGVANRGTQPNQRISAPHSAVTALAQNGKRPAVGRARYAQR